ncbi:MAG: hypothetical protein HY707_02420 [Ignavibacteriae bacterium]|nr:hypothetical protein [Ignavibacteriota bacterium]
MSITVVNVNLVDAIHQSCHIPRMSDVLLVMIVMVGLFLNSCSSNKDDVDLFYQENKGRTEKLALFIGVNITPYRDNFSIQMLKYRGIRFVVRRNDDAKITFMKSSESSFAVLENDFSIQRAQAQSMIQEIFAAFNELNITAFFGGLYYVEFVVGEDKVIVYVPDQEALSEVARAHLDQKKNKVLKIYDEKWFSYKPERPFRY